MITHYKQRLSNAKKHFPHFFKKYPMFPKDLRWLIEKLFADNAFAAYTFLEAVDFQCEYEDNGGNDYSIIGLTDYHVQEAAQYMCQELNRIVYEKIPHEWIDTIVATWFTIPGQTVEVIRVEEQPLFNFSEELKKHQ